MRDKKTGKNVTFYQLLVPKEVGGLDETFETFDQGVKVDLWRERGLWLGIAQEN